jgi:hypothetical protein
VEVTVYQTHEQQLHARRALAERIVPRSGDVLLWEQGAQEADGVALELHHAIAGTRGEYRAGAPEEEFDALFTELQSHISRLRQLQGSHRIDK